MKVELRNVKYAAFASEETSCFQATIYIEGKRAGEVSNDGHGGSDNIHPDSVRVLLDAYGATLPNYDASVNLGEPAGTRMYPQDAETIIADLFTDWQYRRDLTRALSKKLLFTKAGEHGIFQSKTLAKPALARVVAEQSVFEKARSQLKADKILNCLPLDEALAIYRSSTT